MATSIASYVKHEDNSVILNAILTDLTMLRTAYNTLATKLNADEGVTDTNYAQASALETTV